MRLSQVMIAEGVDPATVTLMCHTPTKPSHRRILPWFAAERRDLLDAYQNTHLVRYGRSLMRRPLTLSFVAVPSGSLAFAGLFSVTGGVPRTVQEMEVDPLYLEMSRRIGGDAAVMDDVYSSSRDPAAEWLSFDLADRPEMAALIGRLHIPRPGTQAYIRYPETFDPEIVAITPTSVLAAAPPDWRELTLTAAEVRSLPQSWATMLAEWRGVYFILDTSDGRGYVGSAYGRDNLLGRWREHVRGEFGETARLRERRTAGFRFSVLERVSPDLPADDVTRLEQTWMKRLQTRDHGLNR